MPCRFYAQRHVFCFILANVTRTLRYFSPRLCAADARISTLLAIARNMLSYAQHAERGCHVALPRDCHALMPRIVTGTLRQRHRCRRAGKQRA